MGSLIFASHGRQFRAVLIWHAPTLHRGIKLRQGRFHGVVSHVNRCWSTRLVVPISAQVYDRRNATHVTRSGVEHVCPDNKRCKVFVIGWRGYTIGAEEGSSMPFALVLYDELLATLQANSHICRSVPAGCLEGWCCQTAILNDGWFGGLCLQGAIQQATIYQIWHYWGYNHAAEWLPLFPTSSHSLFPDEPCHLHLHVLLPLLILQEKCHFFSV